MLFRAIWLAVETVLHFDKYHEHETRNYFPSLHNNVDKNKILMTKLEL